MKYSKQRELILRIVKENRTHLSANQVWQKAAEVMPSLGIATVYRNLNALAQAGDIRRIFGEEGAPDRFDGEVCEHYHMRCRACGRVFDLHMESDDDAEKIKEVVCRTFGLDAGTAALNHVLVNGICADCGDIQ